MNNVLTTILERVSVRSFKEDKVPREDLELMIKAGMAAPSAVNKQPWEFIIVDSSALLFELGSFLPYAKMTKFAPAAIVVCGNQKNMLDGWEESFWVQDCSAATQNILLTVESLSYGAVWTAIYPDMTRIHIVKRILDLPHHIIPLNVIPIGIPEQNYNHKDKFDPSKIHYNRW
ncbi:nitroreductase family protein [Halosquirtibacter xylanolyticus]|uniref:nitroreductase family protein n=1 Tax=Halosquirtibacter xylanolyticus TaxID=3374599 RepID=UPI00374A0B65|nr:nitroreductase family protein [Prolixibacteraceae bacterium]